MDLFEMKRSQTFKNQINEFSKGKALKEKTEEHCCKAADSLLSIKAHFNFDMLDMYVATLAKVTNSLPLKL